MTYFLKYNKNGTTTGKKLILVLCDIIFICLSMAAAYIIRSRFIYFIFSDLYLFYCLPYVLLFRLLINLIFDFYSLDLRFMTLRDILNLYLINIIPTICYSLIRLFSPIEVLRIPFSMIFAEYFFTILLISISRICINALIKRRRIKDQTFHYRKKALLLLHLQFSESAVSSIAANHHLNVIGILTENRLLWGSDCGSVRVIGGWKDMRDVIITHNHDLLVVFDGTLDEATKLHLYEEVIDLGAYPVLVSAGQLRFPTLLDLLDEQKTFADFIPGEIEAWLKTQRFLISGDAFEQYSELIKYFDALAIPYTVKSDVSSSSKEANGIILDFRFMAAFEAGQLTAATVAALSESLRQFQNANAEIDYLLVLPNRAVNTLMKDLLTWSKITVLMINDYFHSNRQLSLYAATSEKLERASETLAAVFKALYAHKEKQSRFYRYESLDKIDWPVLKANTRLTLFLPEIAGQSAPSGGAPISLFPPTKPTSFSGLSASDEGL